MILSKYRIMPAVAVLIFLLGCGTVGRQADGTAAGNTAAGALAAGSSEQTRADLTPAESGAWVRLAVGEAIQNGEVWVLVSEVPPQMEHRWHIALTDSVGHNFVLGAPLHSHTPVAYLLPEDAAPGPGMVWLGAGDDPASPGTMSTPVTVIKAIGIYESKKLGVRFKTPSGWRLHDRGEQIVLQRTWQTSDEPVQDILIERRPAGEYHPDGSEMEAFTKSLVGGRSVSRVRVVRHNERHTTSWREIHSIVETEGAAESGDSLLHIILRCRVGEENPQADSAYDQVLKSLQIIPRQ